MFNTAHILLNLLKVALMHFIALLSLLVAHDPSPGPAELEPWVQARLLEVTRCRDQAQARHEPVPKTLDLMYAPAGALPWGLPLTPADRSASPLEQCVMAAFGAQVLPPGPLEGVVVSMTLHTEGPVYLNKTLSDPRIGGSLDMDVIDAVVQRNMAQIRYCYQRELARNPALGGKLTLRFVIVKDGTVNRAETLSSTLNNAAVEKCVPDRFLRFRFPEPVGGGVITVTYPFLFTSGEARTLPEAQLMAVQSCLVGTEPVSATVPLELYLYVEGDRAVRAEVVMSAAPVTDRSECLLGATQEMTLAPGWHGFKVPMPGAEP